MSCDDLYLWLNFNIAAKHYTHYNYNITKLICLIFTDSVVRMFRTWSRMGRIPTVHRAHLLQTYLYFLCVCQSKRTIGYWPNNNWNQYCRIDNANKSTFSSSSNHFPLSVYCRLHYILKDFIVLISLILLYIIWKRKSVKYS